MDYIYDNEVRNTVLGTEEKVLHLLKPGKKAFLFYRVLVPALLLTVVFIILLSTNIGYSIKNGLSLSGAVTYISCIIFTLLLSLINLMIQKKMYAKRAYYITDKRILIVGGFIHLKYQTLNFRFVGSAIMRRTMFSKMFGMSSYSINLIMNINKQLTIKFFSLSGTSLSYLESADKAYKQIVDLTYGN